MTYKEIESIEELKLLLEKKSNIKAYAFQNIDFSQYSKVFFDVSFEDCIFLGCKIPAEDIGKLSNGNYLFPQLNVPYNCYPANLYSIDTLYENYITGQPESYKQTLDGKIYKHYISTGKEASSINETLARRLHDHAITDAIYDFIDNYNEKKIVAIMGGHALSRADESYKSIAKLAKILSESGYLMVTGGGPGAMEATHLGVWFAERSAEDLETAIHILAKAPDYKSTDWLDTAFQVIDKYPKKNNFESLGIPTWLYGHEPATPFATKIGKYFANSVREDGLLTIAKGGVVFSPGSAGTVQEIFQDATQNHYKSFGYSSPMIFMGEKFWSTEFPVYPFLQNCMQIGQYKNLLLSISDNPAKIKEILDAFSC